MQAIAAENNLSETAFVRALEPAASPPRYHIRWFTPPRAPLRAQAAACSFAPAV